MKDLDANDRFKASGFNLATMANVEIEDMPEKTEPQAKCSWPAPLGPKARIGLFWKVIELIEPHTEADPMAIGSQFLVFFGNCVGRFPFFRVEDSKHHANLFSVIVGNSSKARKGTSEKRIKALFKKIDPAWLKDCVKSGLTSGAGLKYHIRDAVIESKVKPEIAKAAKLSKADLSNLREEDFNHEITDVGVSDKRLLCVESEFASVLRVMERTGNTLSAVIRNLFDDGCLNSLTKSDSITVTDSHVSISGHIVRQELLHYLRETESANGFGNRFLWFCVKRSKLLPHGSQPDAEAMRVLSCHVADAVAYCHEQGGPFECYRDEDASKLWEEVYPKLSRAVPGLLGSMTARAEALVTRISVLFALLDMSNIITVEHLEAALEVWRYCFDSARFLFGDGVGNQRADEILALLREKPQGLSQTELRDHFGRHKSKETSEALSLLVDHNLVESSIEKTTGRPRKRWALKRVDDE